MSEEKPKSPSPAPSMPFQGSMMSAAERAERADGQIERALAALETLAGAGKLAAESYASVTEREIALRDAELEEAKRTAAQRAQGWELLGAIRDNVIPILNAVTPLYASEREDASTSEVLRELAIRIPLEIGRKRLDTDSEELATLEQLAEPTDADRARIAELQESTGMVRAFIEEMEQKLANYLQAERTRADFVKQSDPTHFTRAAPGSSGRLPSDIAAKIRKEAEQRVEQFNGWLVTDRAALQYVLEREQSLSNIGERSESMETLSNLLRRQKASLMASIEMNEARLRYAREQLKIAEENSVSPMPIPAPSLISTPTKFTEPGYLPRAFVEQRASVARSLMVAKLGIESMLRDDGEIIRELSGKQEPLSAEQHEELDSAMVSEAANFEALLHLDRMIEQSEAERAANGDPPIGIRLEYTSKDEPDAPDPSTN